jgi:antitoxin component of RelBE/YafQ-DinJ toxin-antitoxin module
MEHEHRTLMLYARVSPSEQATARRLAERLGVSMSDCMRLALRDLRIREGVPAAGLAEANEIIPSKGGKK